MSHYIFNGQTVKDFDLFTFESWAQFNNGVSTGVVERYKTVPWLYRGVELRAQGVAGMPYGFFVGDEELEDYDPGFDLFDFLNKIEGDQTLFGASYFSLGINAAGLPRQVQRLHPNTIQPLYNTDMGLTGFQRSLGSVSKEISLNNIGYLWQPNRENEWGPGSSPAFAALSAAGVLASIDSAVESHFTRGMIGTVIVTVKEATKATRNKIAAWIQRRLGRGISSASETLVVDSDISVERLSESDLDKQGAPALTADKRNDIATALGIPNSLLWSNALAGGTADADQLAFYMLCIVPECLRIQEALNKYIFSRYSVELRFLPDRLEVYQAQQLQTAQTLKQLVGKPIMSVNEAREWIDLPPIADGDNLSEPPSIELPPTQYEESTENV